MKMRRELRSALYIMINIFIFIFEGRLDTQFHFEYYNFSWSNISQNFIQFWSKAKCSLIEFSSNNLNEIFEFTPCPIFTITSYQSTLRYIIQYFYTFYIWATALWLLIYYYCCYLITHLYCCTEWFYSIIFIILWYFVPLKGISKIS